MFDDSEESSSVNYGEYVNTLMIEIKGDSPEYGIS